MKKYRILNSRAPRVDAVDKVTGRAVYTDDMKRPGMLYGAILHSSLPHARIVSIDTSAAEKLPGVKAVVTHKDTRGVSYGVSPARYDEQILASDKVRYVGDEIAAVAAVDPDIARDALEIIKVEFEELPPVFDANKAMDEGAPQLHDKPDEKPGEFEKEQDFFFVAGKTGFSLQLLLFLDFFHDGFQCIIRIEDDLGMSDMGFFRQTFFEGKGKNDVVPLIDFPAGDKTIQIGPEGQSPHSGADKHLKESQPCFILVVKSLDVFKGVVDVDLLVQIDLRFGPGLLQVGNKLSQKIQVPDQHAITSFFKHQSHLLVKLLPRTSLRLSLF